MIDGDSGRLRDSIDSDAISSELIRVVEQPIAPTRVTVWITPSASRPASLG
jgi:hypothetical protein